MSEAPSEAHHLRVAFHTNFQQYAIADAKSFSVPKSVGPNELNDIVSALAAYESAVRMNFFVSSVLVRKSLAEAIAEANVNAEEIIEILYAPQVQANKLSELGHADWIRSLAPVSNGVILTGSYDFRLRCCELDGVRAAVLHEGTGHRGAVTDICVTRVEGPGAFHCATASQDGCVKLWKYTKDDGFNVVTTHRKHTGGVQAIDFSRSLECFISGGSDSDLHLWKTDGHSQSLRGHTDAVTACTFAGASALSASMDGTIREWDTATAQNTQTLDTKHAVHCLSCVPGSALVLAGHANCAITLNDVRARSTKISMRGHSKWVYALAASSETQFLSTAEDTAVCLWDVRFHRSPVFSSKAVHTDAALAACVVGDGAYATAGKDRRVVLTSFAQ